MPSTHGGAGRGQGRPLTPRKFGDMVARIGRMVERLERQGEPAGVELTLATVNLNAYVNRLLALQGLERAPELTPGQREAAHAWAVEVAEASCQD